MQLLIKNMVCNRCIKVVREELERLDLQVISVELGFAEIKENPDETLLNEIQKTLQKDGFELLEDQNLAIVEHIKRLIINEIHYNKGGKPESQNFSDFLVKKIGYEYSYLRKRFKI